MELPWQRGGSEVAGDAGNDSSAGEKCERKATRGPLFAAGSLDRSVKDDDAERLSAPKKDETLCGLPAVPSSHAEDVLQLASQSADLANSGSVPSEQVESETIPGPDSPSFPDRNVTSRLRSALKTINSLTESESPSPLLLVRAARLEPSVLDEARPQPGTVGPLPARPPLPAAGGEEDSSISAFSPVTAPSRSERPPVSHLPPLPVSHHPPVSHLPPLPVSHHTVSHHPPLPVSHHPPLPVSHQPVSHHPPLPVSHHPVANGGELLAMVDPYTVLCPLERFHIFMHLARMSSQALEAQAKGLPDAVVHPAPSGTSSTPNGVAPKLNRLDPTLSGVDPEPNRSDPALTRVDPEPNRFDPTLSGVDQKPSGVDQKPSRFDPTLSGVDQKPSRFDPSLSGVAPSPSVLALVPPCPSPGTSASLADSGVSSSPRSTDGSVSDVTGQERALSSSLLPATRFYIPDFAPFASHAAASVASHGEMNDGRASSLNTGSEGSSSAATAAVRNDRPRVVNIGSSGLSPAVAGVTSDGSFPADTGSGRPPPFLSGETELLKTCSSPSGLARPDPLKLDGGPSASCPSFPGLHRPSPPSQRPRDVGRHSGRLPSSSAMDSCSHTASQPLHRGVSPSEADVFDSRDVSSPRTTARFARDAQDQESGLRRHLTFTEGKSSPEPLTSVPEAKNELVQERFSPDDLGNGDKETRKSTTSAARKHCPETPVDVPMETSESPALHTRIGVKRNSTTLADASRSYIPVVENISPTRQPTALWAKKSLRATRVTSRQERAPEPAAQARGFHGSDFQGSDSKTSAQPQAAPKVPGSTKPNSDAAGLSEPVSEQSPQSNTGAHQTDSVSKTAQPGESKFSACNESEDHTKDSRLSDSNLEPTGSARKAPSTSERKTKRTSGSGNPVADQNLRESDAGHRSPSTAKTTFFNTSDPASLAAYVWWAHGQSLGSIGAGPLASCAPVPSLTSLYDSPSAQDNGCPQIPSSASHHAPAPSDAGPVLRASGKGDHSPLTILRLGAESPNLSSVVPGWSGEGDGSSRDPPAPRPTPGPAGGSPVAGWSEDRCERRGVKRRRFKRETSTPVSRTPNTSGESGFESGDDTLRRWLVSGAEEGGPQGGKRTRRGRTNYSREEVECLEQEFSHSQYVSQFTRDSLSRRLGLTQDQVKVWFQNRRMKAKKWAEGRCQDPRGADRQREEGELTLQELYMPKGGTSVQAMSRLGIHLPAFLGSNKPLTRTYAGHGTDKDKDKGKDVDEELAPPAPLTYQLPPAPAPFPLPHGAFGSLGSEAFGGSGNGAFGSPGGRAFNGQGNGAFGSSGSGAFGSQGSGAFGSSGGGAFNGQGNGAFGSQGSGAFGNSDGRAFHSQGNGAFGSQGSGAFGGLHPAALARAALGGVAGYGGLGGYGALGGFGGLRGLVGNPFFGTALVHPGDDLGLTGAGMMSALPCFPPGTQHLAPVHEHQPGHHEFKMHLLKQLGISDSTIAEAKRNEEEARSKARAARGRSHHGNDECRQQEVTSRK